MPCRLAQKLSKFGRHWLNVSRAIPSPRQPGRIEVAQGRDWGTIGGISDQNGAPPIMVETYRWPR